MHYADTSALVKLVTREPETDALREWLDIYRADLASSDLVRVELLRAVRRTVPSAAPDARDLLSRVTLLTATSSIFDDAAILAPTSLRSLDAVHLASALLLGDELETFVTYDHALADAAVGVGLKISAPGM